MLNIDFTRMSQRPPEIVDGDLRLRMPQVADYDEWIALRETSRAHLTKWEPDWTQDDVSVDAFRARVKTQEKLQRAGVALSFFICDESSGKIVGGATLSDIRHHAAHSATIGYWIGAAHLRRGHGSAAVRLIVDHAFGPLRLNRVEAACQPGNGASIGLLTKLGFKQEGFARDFLYINGAWRDHLLFAVTARDYCGAPLAP